MVVLKVFVERFFQNFFGSSSWKLSSMATAAEAQTTADATRSHRSQVSYEIDPWKNRNFHEKCMNYLFARAAYLSIRSRQKKSNISKFEFLKIFKVSQNSTFEIFDSQNTFFCLERMDK